MIDHQLLHDVSIVSVWIHPLEMSHVLLFSIFDTLSCSLSWLFAFATSSIKRFGRLCNMQIDAKQGNEGQVFSTSVSSLDGELVYGSMRTIGLESELSCLRHLGTGFIICCCFFCAFLLPPFV